MLRTRQVIYIFIPALLVAAFGLFIKIVQYEPLFPKERPVQDTSGFRVPIAAEDPILGDKKAPITAIVFGDFGCDNCREEDAILTRLLKKYPSRVKIIWKGVPITHFPFDTTMAHVYAYCAQTQGKFANFKEYAFLNADHLTEDTLKGIAEKIELNERKLSECLEAGNGDAYVENAKQLAEVLNIQSLPAVFINNSQIPTPNSLEEWESVLSLQ